jgi:hypothetical protein
MKGGAKVVIEKHRHEGIFIAQGKEDALATKNMVPGESVYGEKRLTVEVSIQVFSTFCIRFLHLFHRAFYVVQQSFFSRSVPASFTFMNETRFLDLYSK